MTSVSWWDVCVVGFMSRRNDAEDFTGKLEAVAKTAGGLLGAEVKDG